LIDRKFPTGKKESGVYLRSAEFSYIHYKEFEDCVRIVYLIDDINNYKEYMNGSFIKWLESIRGR
jgi:hypothetical protein